MLCPLWTSTLQCCSPSSAPPTPTNNRVITTAVLSVSPPQGLNRPQWLLMSSQSIVYCFGELLEFLWLYCASWFGRNESVFLPGVTLPWSTSQWLPSPLEGGRDGQHPKVTHTDPCPKQLRPSRWVDLPQSISNMERN